MNPDENSNDDIIVNFITKNSKYSIPSIPINIKLSSTINDLNKILKTLIIENSKNENIGHIEFDFLINNQLLRQQTLKKFIEEQNDHNNKDINIEKQLEIEYFLRYETPKPFKSLKHNDWISSVDIFDNKFILSGSYDNQINIWDINDNDCKHLLSFMAHQSSIKAVKWIKQLDNQKLKYFVTCSHDETSILWSWSCESNQIEHLYTFIGHCRSVDCCDQCNDLIATGSYDNMLKIWSINLIDKDADDDKTKKLRSPILTMEGHKEAITGLKWLKPDPDDQSDQTTSTIITVSLDQTIKLWDIELDGRQQKQSIQSNKSMLDVTYCRENLNLILTSSCDQLIRLWDLRQDLNNQNGTLLINKYYSHTEWISSLDWSTKNSNNFISGSYDKCVKLWDLRSTRQPLYDLLGHQDKIMSVKWSSNNQLIISGGADGYIKIFKNFS